MKNVNLKIKIVRFTTILAFISIIIRIFYISLIDTTNLPLWKVNYIPTNRGSIFDRNGSFLALTVPAASIFIRPNKFTKNKNGIRRLSKASGISQKKIINKIKYGNPSFVWLARQISPSIGKRIKKARLKGVEVTTEPKRVYPYNSLAAHLIGFAGIDHKGLVGIEKSYDDILKATGKDNDEIKNITLTIDRIAQYISEDELKKSMQKTRATAGTAIIYDPNSGEIISIANWPTFNLNNFAHSGLKSFLNRAISHPYETGSIMKMFTAAYLIEHKKISLKEKFNCQGKIKIYDHEIKCEHKHYSVNIESIIKFSCNVGMLQLAKRINSNKYYKYLSDLGFGKTTKIKLPGEYKGILRKPSKWSRLSKYMMSIGYEMSATPLQIVVAMGSLVNGGRILQPIITKQITTIDGKIIKSFKTKTIKQLFTPYTSKLIKMIFQKPLEKFGTGEKAKIKGIEMGGKTGTASIPKKNGKGYYADRYNASFIGYITFRKKNFIVFVNLKNPRGKHQGGEVAAPLFKKISKRFLDYLQKNPNM